MKKSRICANCGTELKEGGKFCYKCGQKYEAEHLDENSVDALNEKQVVCENCGFPIEKDSQYCAKCGYKVGGDKVGGDKKNRRKFLSIKNVVIIFVVIIFIFFFATGKNDLDDDTIGYTAWCVAAKQLKYDSFFEGYEIVDSMELDLFGDGGKVPVYFVMVRGNAQNGFGASTKVKFEVVLINPSKNGDTYEWAVSSAAEEVSSLSDDLIREDLRTMKVELEETLEETTGNAQNTMQ